MSQVSADAILKVLKDNFVQAGITTVDNLSDLQALVDSKPDLLFLGMQYVHDDSDKKSKVWLSNYLDERGIAYTGSSYGAHILELNKHKAKQAVADAGLKTSPFVVMKDCDRMADTLSQLTFPMFVKPTNKGGGAGIDVNSVVRNEKELRLKVGLLTENNWTKSLVEQYLTGREFSVAIIDGDNGLTAMPIELIAQPDENGLSILSRNVKASNNESVLAVSEPGVYESVTSLAIKAFKALGARDYGRIDIRMDDKGAPHFLEANLIPSLIEGYGSFPKACLLNHDLDYEPMILRIVDLASQRAGL
jgi:D-alanine-D-alanine ligase